MQYNIDTGTFQVVMESADINAVVGESAKIQVEQAIDYIKSGQAEIEEAVQEGISSFDSNATQKTNTFNTNAGNRLSEYNSNADNKLEAYNNNATSKTNAFNQNATDKTTAFNSNATAKTGDFNDNYTSKKALIDAQVNVAEGAATTATNQAGLAKQWAIGDPSEPTGNSAKYWAEQASSTLSGLTTRVSAIEGKIPSEASASNQLADKSWVENKGYITGITSGDVTTALGYTPYNSSNPDGYQTSSDVATAISGKQDTLTAGTNIQINNNVISATGTTYTAGTGIDITNGVISNTQTSSWGNITGTLSDQTDLNTALNGKLATDLSNLVTAGQEALVDLLYPVGSVYIGTGVSCPLSAIKGTWTLISSGVVTAVNSNVPCKGNGMTMGLETSNNRHFGLCGYGGNNTGALVKLWTDGDMYGENIGTAATTSESSTTSVISHGLTTDETKSGIVGTASSTTLSVNIWERTA